MNYYDLAKLIPAKFRSIILKNNHIYKSVIEFYDYDMMQLWFYWANFIEPQSVLYKYKIENGKIVVMDQCKICLRVLRDRWILLEPYLILLERENNLLSDL